MADLPLNLRTSLDQALGSIRPSELAQAARELSIRYRGPATESPFLRSEMEVLAYGAYRLPATYAAIHAAITEVKGVLPEWRPRSLLDVGAGPGTASWAAAEAWSSIEVVELVERDGRMIELGKDLMKWAGSSAFSAARWNRSDIVDWRSSASTDLIIVSYALGEVDGATHDQILERLWRSTSGVLLLVEPGTPGGFEVIRTARAHLISLGANVIAPCPHSANCPMANGNWCHFSRRLARSRSHRLAKDVTMGYEDEKFSYVAMTSMSVAPAQSRVLRHPQVRPGHIRLELCTRSGLQHQVVTKKDRIHFRAARHAGWGSAFSLSGERLDSEPGTVRESHDEP